MVYKKINSKLKKKAIRLPSSGKIYGHDDGSFVERTLISLLEECHEKNLPKNVEIIVTDEYLDENKMPEDCNNPEKYLRTKKSIIKVKHLYNTYKYNYHQDYTPENERERSGFNMEVMHKQGDRRAGWGFFGACIRQENEAGEEQIAFQKGGREAVEKLRKSRGSNNLVIG